MMSSRTLGDYTLIKQIGQGPLGAVFLAEQRFMKKQFAIKVLPEDLASDRNFIQRFEEEVGRLSVLDHPNIVKIHNVSFAEGRYFLVTDCVVDEYGETTNLSQYMAAHGKRLDEVELLRLTKQIAQALDYAHNAKVWGKEVVHRGIKLNNILVGKEEEGAYLVLSDFGLSRIIGTGNVLTRTYQAVAESLGVSSAGGGKREQVSYSHSSLETQKLAALHTSFLQNYAFLAPEQKKMDHSIDGKADIYAFGVLAYFLIMGKFPEGIFDMPSQKAREYRYDWDRLICRCLQSDPEKRPSVLMPLLDEIVQRKFSSDAISLSDQKVEVSREQKSPSSVLEKEEKKRGPKPVLHDPQLERPEDDLVDPPTELQVEEPSVKRYRPERQEVKNIQPLLTDMVVIEGGKFYRGSNDGNRDEMPCHEVILPSFAIDIHPVTNEQFVRFLEVMGGEKDSGHRDIIRLRDSRIKRSGGKLNVESGYLKHPVVGVTWYGAVAYAKWVGKRLPTEAEWEIAACGGLKSPLYPTGDEIEKTQANFFSSDTTAVMSYAPNGRGLYDMAGNVYEWCQDWYDYNYYDTAMQEPDNPRGPLQGVYRVLRGGCWKSLKEDLRCSRRHRNNPGTVNGTYGFRCAADVE